MSYRVVVTREGGAWLAEVPELEGAHTWARNLPTLDEAVREVIVLAADLPDEAMPDLDLVYEYRTGDSVIDKITTELRRERRRLHEAEREVAERTESTARELVKNGYSVRDAAVLTGVSYQRVSQLTHRFRRARERPRVGAHTWSKEG